MPQLQVPSLPIPPIAIPPGAPFPTFSPGPYSHTVHSERHSPQNRNPPTGHSPGHNRTSSRDAREDSENVVNDTPLFSQLYEQAPSRPSSPASDSLRNRSTSRDRSYGTSNQHGQSRFNMYDQTISRGVLDESTLRKRHKYVISILSILAD